MLNRLSEKGRLLRPVPAVWMVAVVAWFGACLCAEPATAEDLNAAELEVLKSLDGATITTALSLVDDVKKLRAELDALKGQAAALGDTLDDLKRRQNLSTAIVRIAETVVKSTTASPKLATYLGDVRRIQAELAAAEEAWKNVNDATLREEAKLRAYDAAGKRLLEQFERETFAKLNSLSNPAQYAQNYLKGEFEQWVSQPRTHEAIGGLEFKIVRPEANRSIFDPQGGLTVEVEYKALSAAKVEATGLYFEYENGKTVPKPNIDNLQVRPNWQGILEGQLTKALGELFSSLGLGITISDIQAPSFKSTGADDKRRGGLKFTVSLKFWEGIPEFIGKATVYPADATLKWEDGIAAKLELATPVLLGTTGAGLHGGSVQFTPDRPNQRFDFSTMISAAAPQSHQAMNLTVSLGVPVPVNKLTLAGTIKMGGDTLVIGDVKGEFDFAGGAVRTGFKIPGEGNALPIGQIFNAHGDLTLDGEGLHADAKASLFGMAIDDTKIEIDTHGNGSFSSKSGLPIKIPGGSKLELEASFEPGFQRVQFHAVQRIVGVHLGCIDVADVTLTVTADTDEKEFPIEVTVEAFGKPITVKVANLAEVDVDKLLAQLRKESLDIVNLVVNELRNADRAAAEALAKAEDDFRGEVYDTAGKYGLDRISTGDEKIDQALGDFAKTGKESFDKAKKEKDELVKIGKTVLQNPGQGAEDLLAKGGSVLDEAFSGFGATVSSLPGGNAISGTLNKFGIGGGGGGGGGGPSAKDLADLKAKQLKLIRQGMVFEKTKDLREAIAREGKPGLTRTKNGPEVVRGATKLKESSELNLQFRSPSASLVDDDGALLTIVVPSSGFTESRRPGSQQKPQVKSGVKVATVRIGRLVADPPKEGEVKELPGIAGGIPVPKTADPPTAKINVPKLTHGSQFPAEQLAHVQIQEWIERYLPDVEIQGPKKYVESRLAVKNDTDEPLNLWVKAYHREARDGRLLWDWFPRESEEEVAYRFSVQPGETKLLDTSESAGSSEGKLPSSAIGGLVGGGSRKKAGLLAAARVRLWAESEGGERWLEYQNKDLKIVDADGSLGGEPGYFADSMKTYVHVVRPKKGPRVHSERVLKLANKTSEPLKIELEYRSVEGGVARWRKLEPFEIPAGAFGHPTTAEDMKVRASQIRVVGKGENFYFGRYEREPLDVVEAVEGRRLYSADKIGKFEFTFRPPGKLNTKSTK